MNEKTVVSRFRQLCLSLPEARETSSWGHPNFLAGRRTFASFERIHGRESFAFRLPEEDAGPLLGRAGSFLTPYGRGKWVSLWADGDVDWSLVGDLVERSYRLVALKRMLSALDSL